MDHRSPLPVDTLLDGHFRIRDVIGSGGFGITYVAEDLSLGRQVAIKEYFPSAFGIRETSMEVRPRSAPEQHMFDHCLAGFKREARTLAQFRHPSIVRVIRVLEDNNTAYMVMEFEHGQSLKGWLETLGRQPTEGEIDRLLEPLVSALEVLHRASFIHRDLAPDNVIIRDDGRPVLLDFGAARQVVAEVSRNLTGIVKHGYSPPEQYTLDPKLQGPWTDIYALGAVLYYMVCGEPPTPAPERQLGAELVPAARAARGDYRPELLEAIDQALLLKPAERPQSLAELRDLLALPSDQALGAGRSEPRARASSGIPATRPTTSPAGRSRPGSSLAAKGRARSAPAHGEQPGTESPPSARPRRWPLVAGVLGLVLGCSAMALGVRQWAATTPADRARLEERAAAERQAALDRAAEAERRRKAEEARVAEERRVAAERAEAERQRRAEEARLAAERQAALERERAEAERRRLAEEARLAAERQAAEQKAAEAERQRRAEEARLATERQAALERERAEAERRRQAEEARLAAERQAAEQKAAEAERQRRAEEARLAAERQAQEVVTGLRRELARVGCPSDGSGPTWLQADRRALERFVRHAGGRATGREPLADLLRIVEGIRERVCPLPPTCPQGEVELDGRCTRPPAAQPPAPASCAQINERAQLGLLTEADREVLRSKLCR